jgi:endonuclease-3
VAVVRASLDRRLAVVATRLAAVYGRPRRRLSDPLSGLVETVLSQNTSDVNSGRAYASLRAAFPTWEALAAAQPARIESVIRAGGLARLKSRRLTGLLAAVKQREGRYDLRRLRRLTPEHADARLRGLPGVGPKTRACVLLFNCGHPAFPVDTHVHRVSLRLGLLPPKTDAAKAHQLLAPAVPVGRHLDLHLNLIRLGREVCRAREPRCAVCPLASGCAHAQRQGA